MNFQRHGFRWTLVIFAASAWPSLAAADAGTLLIWGSAFHLLLGNLLIGLLEAHIINRVFKTTMERSGLVMVIANYASTISFYFLFYESQYFYADSSWIDLVGYRMASWFLVGMTAITFFYTLFVEWPFVYFILPEEPGRWKKSLRANLYAQSASYAIIVFIFWLAGSTSFLTELSYADPKTFARDRNVSVYYLDPEGKEVFRAATDGKKEHVAKVKTTINDPCLGLQQNPENKKWSLIAYPFYKEIKHPPEILLPDFFDPSLVDSGTSEIYPSISIYPRWRMVKVGKSGDNKWHARYEIWGYLSIWNGATGRSYYYGLETHFLNFGLRGPIWSLPSGQFIISTRGQIFLLDPVEEKIGVIARGRGPLVIEDRE